MPNTFYETYLPYAQSVSQRTGLDPRLVLAQAALESGWGKGAVGGNFFGIKSHGRPGGQTLVTSEYEGGQYVPQEANFRTYDGPEQSFYDYGSFILENPRYQSVMAADGLQAQIEAMGASGYATDPKYAQKLSSITSMFGGDGGNMERTAQQGLLGPQPRQGDRRRQIAGALASGFNMLRRNPDQNLDASLAHQRQQRQSNRTADWLRQQPGGEMFANMIGAGASGAEALAAFQASKAGPKPTAAAQNYATYNEILRTEGQEAADSFLAMSQRGNSTNINMPGELSDQDKLLGKYQAETMRDLAKEGRSARTALGQTRALEALLGQSPTGFGAGLASWAKDNLGLNIQGDAATAAQAIIAKLVPAQRPAGSGTMSDADLALYQSSLPRLSNTSEGNQIIVDGMKALAAYNVELGRIGDAYMGGMIKYSEAIAMMDEISDPMADVVARIKQGGYDQGSIAPVAGGGGGGGGGGFVRPESVSVEDWEHMTPEEQELFQ